MIRVLFFGQLKDVAGRSEDQLELPAGATLADVFAHYAAAHPRLNDLSRSIVMASNRRFAARTEPVCDGDEVAFLPPVSGGCDPYSSFIEDGAGHFFALTHHPIDLPSLRNRVLRGEDGALVVFEGVARNNSNGRTTRFLDYECYEAMAVQVMGQIGREIAASPEIGRIAIVHRLGRILIGEASVVILVTAPHRAAAFEAAALAIDRLKKRVPIWKREHFEDGEIWVEGEWDSSVVAP